MRRFSLAVATLLVTLTAACGDSSTGPASASIAGSYSLRTINGSSLPYTVVQVGNDKIELVSETLSVAEGGTFTQQGTVRITENGQTSNESYADAGTYTRSGTAVSFRFNSDGSTGTGTVSGDEIIVAVEGYSYVYRR